jgi:D-beta-D-heptose 7-phosphate kinase/D-beta-D-heptose 1-phosphate adenosyltransferase
MPTKRRLYCDNIPLNRWDFEKENYGLDDIKKHLLDLEIPNANYNIFSDYSKGVFSMPWFRKYIKNSPSVVDPKNNFIDFWEDCTIFKPNAVEAKNLSDKRNWKDQAEFFLDCLRCDGVVITQSGDGVVGKEDDFFEIRPEIGKIKPESVIGAGDCFVSHLSMALSRGFNLEEACQIAFAAGTFYVQRKHNKPISPAELLSFAGVKELKTAELLTDRNFNLTFTNGCFDFGLTSAHVQCLQFAKKQGDKLVVGLNSDASISRIKGKERPILPFADRSKILAALDCVDYVIGFDEDTPLELIKKIMPDSIVKGGDYKKEDVVGNQLAPVKLFNYLDVMSTTAKIKKIDEIEKYL